MPLVTTETARKQKTIVGHVLVPIHTEWLYSDTSGYSTRKL
jgi:hypothetical protein